MNRQLTAVVLLLSVLALVPLAGAQGEAPFAPTDRSGDAVDLVIALDVSDSMDPLIEATRLELWEIVNSIALSRPHPRLRVALLTFGSPHNNASEGWVKVETDLTTDLDLVAKRLFDLETGGGREYVARAVRVAVEQLSWSNSGEALKLLFVAGNEPADQDPEVSLTSAAYAALDEGIVVNMLYCGRAGQPDAATWKTLAEQTAGRFAAIDPGGGHPTLNTPYDEELARLGREINQTYVPLGDAGQRRFHSIATQDANAARLGAATAAGRARTKAMPGYGAGWDLVASLETGSMELDEVSPTDLPNELRHLSASALEDFVEKQRTRRAELRQRIAELSALRRQHLVAQVEARDPDQAPGFDDAVQRMLHDELRQGGFEVSE